MSLLSNLLHQLANRVDAGECTDQDWTTVTAVVNTLSTASSAEDVRQLKEDLQNLKSNMGYLSKHIESLEHAPHHSQTVIRKL